MRIAVLCSAVLALVLALLPAGPTPEAAAGAVRPGTYKRTMKTPGEWDRQFLLRVPPRTAGRRPLVIALHGGLNDMHIMRDMTGLDAVADREGFLVAYPDGILSTWNAGGCCVFARALGIDDVTFLDRLIDSLVRLGLADPRRVYLTGFSNGGGMAYRYACERPDRVAAVGVVAGALATSCNPSRGTSVITFHGTEDGSVPFEGGGMMDWNNWRPFPSTMSVIDRWRQLNQVGPLSRLVLNRSSTECRATERGPLRTEVRFCKVIDGIHQWPRGTGKGVDASATIWDFFEQERLGAA
ncbi:hypothetical protein DPM19_08600 [Actinomadura craniellae]|uniref:Polyhydroxybutyrate depolymerase n=1 Tax=Actinomadura craniellae TaxID=2231787 RepID=A0A365H9P7_9ACTN|nr:PHB depolymerase family esterase [Actinomadura craniellae]RAY15817.1 hypothetical protein DPM19_08600 [Actinomadura craniellae]